jgi:antagonist of KipI
MAFLMVIRPGMLTTVQDLGRWGQQSSGVPVAGPMDGYSHRLANRLVGNPENAAALEVTMAGPELQARGDVVCAVAGAEFVVEVNGEPIAPGTSFGVPDSGRLRFGPRRAGARATLAVRGGFDVPATFGSRATSLVSRMGPFAGRALLAGDEIPVGASARVSVRPGVPASLPLPAGGARVRILMGPQDAMFTAGAIAALLSSRYIVTAQSNRMGYRLDGLLLQRRSTTDMLSEATPFGSLQVATSGQPILLMADRQTTGGYPKIATVITADLPLAAQLAPGDWIEFEACTRTDAVDALRRQEATLSGAVR